LNESFKMSWRRFRYCCILVLLSIAAAVCYLASLPHSQTTLSFQKFFYHESDLSNWYRMKCSLIEALPLWCLRCLQDTSVVALHEFSSLDDYKPPGAAAAAAAADEGSAKGGAAAAVATAAAIATAAAAGAKHGASSGGGSAGLGHKVGLALGIPAAVLAGAAVVVVAVLRGLSPRR
jgi:hypothetical protein